MPENQEQLRMTKDDAIELFSTYRERLKIEIHKREIEKWTRKKTLYFEMPLCKRILLTNEIRRVDNLLSVLNKIIDE